MKKLSRGPGGRCELERPLVLPTETIAASEQIYRPITLG
ncbi:hypothetical protein BURPS305_3561 [Burkholderia pseudomallei 305]|nr:hypothetical protein BURPS305_3561 [Burkholderia pseudomallei 305]